MLDKSRIHIFKFIILILFAIAVTGFILGNSVASVEQSAEISTGIMQIIKDIIDPQGRVDPELFHHIIRKIAHFVEFSVLGFIYMLIKNHIDGKNFGSLTLFPMFATLATAVVDEYIQFFAGRGSAVKDVVLDFAGAMTGIIMCGAALAVYSYFNRRKN